MSLEYLNEISRSSFPLKVSEEQAIDKVRILVAAGMVIARLPDVGHEGPAIVEGLTGFGRASLKVPFGGPLTPYSGKK
jgi:hypothetical protein